MTLISNLFFFRYHKTSRDFDIGKADEFCVTQMETEMIGRIWHGWTKPESAYVPPKAREVLSRFDESSQHYEIREKLDY